MHGQPGPHWTGERQTGPAQTLESASVDCPFYSVSIIIALPKIERIKDQRCDGSVHVLRQSVSVNPRLLVPVCVRCCLDVPPVPGNDV